MVGDIGTQALRPRAPCPSSVVVKWILQIPGWPGATDHKPTNTAGHWEIQSTEQGTYQEHSDWEPSEPTSSRASESPRHGWTTKSHSTSSLAEWSIRQGGHGNTGFAECLQIMIPASQIITGKGGTCTVGSAYALDLETNITAQLYSLRSLVSGLPLWFGLGFTHPRNG